MQDSSLRWSFNKLKNFLKIQLSCAFVFLLWGSAKLSHLCFFQSVLQPLCVRGGGALMCTLTAFQRPASSLFKKTRKFFMSFCFCVIVNPSCLQSSQLAITTVHFSRIFFENASCKRLVLALACMVGFSLASFETRFKKLTNTCTSTHIKYLQTGAVHHQNFAWW